MNRCCANLTGRTYGTCYRPGKYLRAGKLYCWTHDPDRLAQLAADRTAQRKAEYQQLIATEEERNLRADLERESGVDSLTNEDLQSIITLGGIHKILYGF